jgi:hypothetical protein
MKMKYGGMFTEREEMAIKITKAACGSVFFLALASIPGCLWYMAHTCMEAGIAC